MGGRAGEGPPSAEGRRRREPEIIANLAGPIAEPRANGPVNPASTQADQDRARRLTARVNVHPGEDDPHLRWLRERVETLRTRDGFHAALYAVAAALVERRELGAEEVARIIGDAINVIVRD